MGYQAGSGYDNRSGSAVAHRRGTGVMTMSDLEKHDAKRVAEMALEMAWEGARQCTCPLTSIHRPRFRARHGLVRAGWTAAA